MENVLLAVKVKGMNTSSMIQVIKIKILSLRNLTIHNFYPKIHSNLLTTSCSLATTKLVLKPDLQ